MKANAKRPTATVRARFGVGAFLCVSLALPACYTFQAADPGSVSPGDEVQLVLSRTASMEVTPAALTGETLVQGDLLGVSEDSISVSVWIGEAYRGTPFEPVHQAYSFPRSELLRLERRKLSKPHTALTTLGVLATIYLMIDHLGYLENPSAPPDDDDHKPPLNPAILWWSWPISVSGR